MSFILDALRKSDQQRQRGAAPNLLAVPHIVTEPGLSTNVRYAFLALLLLVIGMTIGWFRPWHSEPAVPAAEPEAARQLDARPKPSVATVAPAPRETPARPAYERSAQGYLSETLPESTQTRLLEKTDTAKPIDARPEPGAMAMDELPLSIQQELPKMVISLHAYSRRPEDRLVSINNRLLHEGGLPATGITLEQITPDGMIFSYKGYRFRRGVQ